MTEHHKQKTKPLSAYNLFFQYHRIKLLQLSSAQAPAPAASADVDSSSLPGLENVDSNSSLLSATEQEIRRHRKQTIERTLDDSPFNAKDKQRSHKKTHGSMTFLEMSSYMSRKWKDADENTKSIFRQISNERKARHQKLEFDLYKARSQKFALNTSSSTTDTIAPPRVVSLDSVTSASGAGSVFKTNQVSSDISLSNASWGHTLSSRNQNQQTENASKYNLFNGIINSNDSTPLLPVIGQNNLKNTSGPKVSLGNNNAMSNINWDMTLTVPTRTAQEPLFNRIMSSNEVQKLALISSTNQQPISPPRVVSEASVTSLSSSSRYAHKTVTRTSNNDFSNANWDHPPPSMNQNQVIKRPFDIQGIPKTESDSCSLSQECFNKVGVVSNFNWEMPMASLSHNECMKTESTIYKAEELLDRPLSFISRDEEMSTEELQHWLSNLDWNKP